MTYVTPLETDTEDGKSYDTQLPVPVAVIGAVAKIAPSDCLYKRTAPAPLAVRSQSLSITPFDVGVKLKPALVSLLTVLETLVPILALTGR